MFLFKRKKSTDPMTVVIDGIDCLTAGQLNVQTIWQQNREVSDLGSMLAKTIVNPNTPIDGALVNYIQSHGLTLPQQQPFRHISFDHHGGISGNVWHHGADYLPVIKGMPEHVLQYCDLSDSERESIMIQLHSMATTGQMIVAVAAGIVPYALKDLRHLKHNDKLSFIGFIGYQAVINPQAKRIINNTDVSIYLITGQHPTATYAIVKQLGLANIPQVIYDARRLDVIGANEIGAIVGTTKIFARATPERKAHIIHAIKAQNNNTLTVKTFEELQKLLAL